MVTSRKRRRVQRAFAIDLELLEERCLLSGATASYGQLPLAFEPNVGQTTAQANFLTQGNGYTLLLNADQATLGLQQSKANISSSPGSPPPVVNTEVLTTRLVGANPAASGTALDQLPGVSNYLIGSNPANWHTNIPNYGQVEYQNVYPGIDQIYYGNQGGELEYDLVVNPGAHVGTIRLAITGAPSMTLDASGDLVLHTAGGDVLEEAPVVYQQVNGARQTVAGRYVLQGNGQVGFAVAAYNASLPLTIDPVLVYSTYLGGTGSNFGQAIAVDAAGNAYVTGATQAPNFPTVGPVQGSLKGGQNVFVSKLNAQGTALVYSTYLGGNSYDEGYGIAVDAAGNAYVTGYTGSTNFPTANAFQETLKATDNVFVTKLNAQGNALVYSTYLGGSTDDYGHSIAVDSAGNAYVTGYTGSTNFPTANALQGALKGSENTFVTKLDAQGSALVYSTYLGGSGADYGVSIAVDAAGDASVTGATTSTNFPTANALQTTLKGTQNAFVSKLNAQGSALVYSTYLGGSSHDAGQGIAVDAAGNAYVTGFADSTNFPTANAWQPTLKGFQNAFVTKLNPQGSALVYSTYLGGEDDSGFGIAVDTAGDAYVAGATESPNFPTVNALQGTLKGPQNAFVTMLNAQGSALVYSTYLGGSSDDLGAGIAVDAAGNAYVAGYTDSTNFPTANAFQGTLKGTSNAFVAKIVTRDWQGESVAVDAGGNTQLLWDSYSGQSVQWAVTNSLSVSSGPAYGPFGGFTAIANAAGADGLTRVLWTNTVGQVALWLENSSGTPVGIQEFGPISGWTAVSVAAGSSGNTFVLWTHTSGAMVVWNVNDGNFSVTSSPVYGPISGWTAKRIATGTDGLVRVLWLNSNGQTALWLMSSGGSIVAADVFGPFSGWTATAIAVGPDDDTRILWNNVDGAIVVWSVSASFSVSSSPEFGPLAGWTAVAVADGSDAIVRLLWENVNGAAALWLLDTNGNYLSSAVFGPF